MPTSRKVSETWGTQLRFEIKRGHTFRVPLIFYSTKSAYALAVAARALGGSDFAWFWDC